MLHKNGQTNLGWLKTLTQVFPGSGERIGISTSPEQEMEELILISLNLAFSVISGVHDWCHTVPWVFVIGMCVSISKNKRIHKVIPYALKNYPFIVNNSFIHLLQKYLLSTFSMWETLYNVLIRQRGVKYRACVFKESSGLQMIKIRK